MNRLLSRTGFVTIAACAVLAACSGGSSTFAPAGGNGFLAPAVVKSNGSELVVSPSHISMLPGAQISVGVRDNGNGKVTSSSGGSEACKHIAKWAPKTGRGPQFGVGVTAIGSGSCAITFTDNHKHTGRLHITVKPAPRATAFAYSGGVQTFKVPPGVTLLTIKASGGQGGYAEGGGDTGGGLGGSVTATIPVTPGESLGIYVGGAGTDPYEPYGNAGGFNGGGLGGCGCGINGAAGSGGGASDVRRGGAALANRVVVAGGGGGGGFEGVLGGAGGGLTGGAGTGTAGYGGAGGTQTSGGAGGGELPVNPCIEGGTGSLGLGGNGGGYDQTTTCSDYGGGGGGGGYYGGGGGGAGDGPQGGALGSGGGGSGFAETSATNVTFGTGTQTGSGVIALSW